MYRAHNDKQKQVDSMLTQWVNSKGIHKKCEIFVVTQKFNLNKNRQYENSQENIC